MNRQSRNIDIAAILRAAAAATPAHLQGNGMGRRTSKRATRRQHTSNGSALRHRSKTKLLSGGCVLRTTELMLPGGDGKAEDKIKTGLEQHKHNSHRIIA